MTDSICIRKGGCRMKQVDRDKAERVRSAKVWLDKAEESFRSSSDVQGELSLLLAEAEMKNLRKNHGTGKNLMRYGAVATALVIALLWLALGQAVRHGETRATYTAPPSEVGTEWVKAEPLRYEAPPRQEAAVQVPAQTVEAVQTYTEGDTQVSVHTTQPETVSTSAASQVMTSAQVQETVQAARHSLRSTESIQK